VAFFSETHLKLHKVLYSIYHFYRIYHYPERKGGTTVTVIKCIPYYHVDLPPLVSVEATRGSAHLLVTEILLAAVYKSPGRTWSDADITEL
jgi:hypothetical protein